MSLYKSLGGHAITASIVEEAWGGQTYGGENKVHYPSMITKSVRNGIHISLYLLAIAGLAFNLQILCLESS